MDDCKGSAALLTSLLRHRLGPDQVFMSVGLYYPDRQAAFLHAWTTVFLPDGTPLALDSTYPRPLPADVWVREAPRYRPFWRANDRVTVVLRPDLAQRYYGRDLRLVQASASVRQTRYVGG